MNIKRPIKEDIPFLRSLWKEAFADNDKFLDDFFSTAFSFERAFCVEENNKIVAALYWFDCEYESKKLAYLYAIATAGEYRGQGICHKLMEFTHKHLQEIGYVGAVLVPGSEELFKYYESMGYKTCGSINQLFCNAKPQKTEVIKIDKNEYAAIRRTLLPAGGIVQENENLDFLITQAELYKGQGFLLTARTFGDTLYGIELLGATDKAGEIVYSLGCKEGKFRVPGEEVRFAMCLPFSCEIMPAYFGLAFD